MTFGILGLLTVGYLWLLEIGVSEPHEASHVTSIVYGSGAALTLDEFALWLNLEDDYWSKQGRESIDAIVLFGSLLSMSLLGRGFVKDIVKLGRGIDPGGASRSGETSTNGRAQPAAGRPR
jgi:hypothetical protein